ncbi:isochorismatase family protein [Streptomyces sp. NPDC006872]|uniref:cysteine hydrolase family protein n=1 Tax=Streptomyces sp. NPDC006872 TaxID=3155720 RepID=UPI0033F6FF76
MDPKPWSGVVSESDVAAFPGGAEHVDRGLSAGTRPAIVVVDMTERFVAGADGDGAGRGTHAIEANRKLLLEAHARRLPVFFTAMWSDPDHPMSPVEWGRWKTPARRAPDSGHIESTGGAIVPQLLELGPSVVVHKGVKPSGFFGTALASYLIQTGADTVVVTGISTSGCVRATALDAFQYNFHVVVPFDCVADRSRISHDVTLFDLHMKYADVVSSAETLDYLRSV